MHKSRVRLMLVALLGVFAFGAVAAVAAQAAEKEEAPFWSIKKVRLGAGETHYITAKLSSASFTLTAGVDNITCTALKLEEGVLLGSAVGEPGTNDEIIEFEGCTVTGNGEGCKVVESKILTTNVRSELVKDVATHEKILVEFKPLKGVVFTTIKFEGEHCTLKEAKVSGETVAEVAEDPKETGKSYLLEFPDKGSLTEVLLVEKGETKVKKLEELTFASNPATLTGIALILLANPKKETELVEWSPLL